MTGSREAGFSLLELLVVVAVLGIVVNIAIPVVHDSMTKAAAAAVLADVDTIHDAVLSYRLERGAYPGTASWGTVPAGLTPYLPPGFSFQRDDVRYRYQLRRGDKRLGIDGGGRRSPGRDVIARVGEGFPGEKVVTARRVWLWLPSPGGRNQ